MSVEIQIEEIKQYLHARGYDERTLNSTDRPGTLIRNMKSQLSELDGVHNNTGEKMHFTVPGNGYFNQKDILHFSFNFSFTPNTGTLQFEGVEGKINACRKGQYYPAEELPHSQEFHSDLRSLEETILANSLSHHAPQRNMTRKI